MAIENTGENTGTESMSNAGMAGTSEGGDKDVLIVVSKLKNYIRATSEMNTSGNVAPVLSDMIRKLCDDAVSRARNDGRKTVMDRDFQLPSSTSI